VCENTARAEARGSDAEANAEARKITRRRHMHLTCVSVQRKFKFRAKTRHPRKLAEAMRKHSAEASLSLTLRHKSFCRIVACRIRMMLCFTSVSAHGARNVCAPHSGSAMDGCFSQGPCFGLSSVFRRGPARTRTIFPSLHFPSPAEGLISCSHAFEGKIQIVFAS
jgi:hypothetical protein